MTPTRHAIVLRLAATALLAAAGAAAEQAPPIPMAELRTLSRDEVARRPAATARGVVTFKWRQGMQSFAVQDGDLSIWVSLPMARTEHVWAGDEELLATLHEGQEVELEGVMEGGGYSPNLLPRTLRVLGERPLPPAREVPLTLLLRGALDSQRVAVAGVVQRCGEPRNGMWLLQVETGVGRLLAHVPIVGQGDPVRLVDAEVRLRGVAASSRNWRAEFVCPRLLVASPDDVVVERPAPADPFAVPAVALNALAAFSPTGRPLHRCRIAGTVTHCEPGVCVYLQDGACAVRVGTAGTAALRPGERVEASGFIDASGAVAGLSEAQLRPLGPGTPPEPVPTALADIQAAFASVRTQGRPASPHDYDGLLVSVTGRLLDARRDLAAGGYRLVLDCGGALTTAELGGGAPADGLDGLRPGSVLRVAGVAIVQYASDGQVADYVRPTRLDLLLRGADDVTVLGLPSWWTPQRLGLALAGSIAVLAAAAAWILALRRALRRRTSRLEQVMRTHRDSELEFKAAQHERQRLAADMHDGLQQLIAGAAFRLEAAVAHLAEVPPAVQAQLTAARGALLRTQEGLRDCVWGLRHVEEGPGEFAALLEHAAASMDHWPRGAVAVRVMGTPFALSRHVMGSLLMLMQEAVGNALRHGRAQRVAVVLDYHDDALAMRIEDDGAGFDPRAAPGTATGHFGLESMRHRMSWLGGGVEIASGPGRGAVVTIRLPRARAQAADAPAPASAGAAAEAP